MRTTQFLRRGLLKRGKPCEIGEISFIDAITPLPLRYGVCTDYGKIYNILEGKDNSIIARYTKSGYLVDYKKSVECFTGEYTREAVDILNARLKIYTSGFMEGGDLYFDLREGYWIDIKAGEFDNPFNLAVEGPAVPHSLLLLGLYMARDPYSLPHLD